MKSAILALMILLSPFAAFAQSKSAGLNFLQPGTNQPVSIESDQGIEWHMKEKMYIIKGHARAVSGQVAVLADELRGYYRDQKSETKKTDAANPLGMLGGGGSMELYRLEAIGNVHIETADQQAQGDQAFYDLDQSVFSLTGKNLGMKSATGTVTATDSLEYWQHKQMAVARGNAVVVQGTNRVAADVVTAYFAPDQTGANSLARAEAVNNVRIQARAALAQGDRAVYDLHQGIATIQGNVRLTQGNNQMNGDYAEVNMNTGVSKLLAAQDGSTRRVQGLIVPQKAKNIKPAAVQ